jgi:outer membrane protein assembly factor BamB
MNRQLRIGLGLVIGLVALGDARAQSVRGLITAAEAGRFGLERMWFTRIAVDSARGRVIQLTQHVSATESTTVYEFVHDDKTYTFRETDLDEFGRVIGKDRARRLAEIKLSDLRVPQPEEQLVERTIPRIAIYAVTDSGRIHAIDGETGRTLWKAAVGNPRYPTESIGANDNVVAAVNGSTIYLLKASTGELVWERKAGGAPGAGPAVTSNLVFVPMTTGVMEAYPIDNPVARSNNFRSHGRAMIQPVYTGTYVAWPTDRGHLYVTEGTENRINYRLEANATIVARPAFLPPDRIVVSSVDGFVYCLREDNGELQWRFSTGEPIVTTPVGIGDAVYAVTTDGSLFVINAATGHELWSASRMALVIGASKDRLYCLNDTNRLTVFDRQSGSQLGSLSTEFNDLVHVNSTTDRILIGTASGVLQCLRERSQEHPLLHIELKKPEAGKPKKAAAPGVKKVEPVQESADPFKFPAPSDVLVDPFGTDGGGAKPANPPAVPKPVDDPFGD